MKKEEQDRIYKKIGFMTNDELDEKYSSNGKSNPIAEKIGKEFLIERLLIQLETYYDQIEDLKRKKTWTEM